MSQTCPKCGHERRPSDTAAAGECPRCGIIYAKFRALAEPAGVAVRPEHEPQRARLTLEGAVGFAAAACAALLAIKGMRSGVGLEEALLTVPFFFCFVPVLTHAFGEGPYFWNKHRMRFDLYDPQEHPVLSKVYFVFFAAASVTFAVFLLTFGR